MGLEFRGEDLGPDCTGDGVSQGRTDRVGCEVERGDDGEVYRKTVYLSVCGLSLD